jgi:uncharacterized protein DUF1565
MKINQIIGCLILVGGLCSSAVQAQDWYVKAGAKGGKGTIEKPYKGIYKALGKALKGDVIHVTQGGYSGKLKAGFIIINTRGLTLLGGYNDDFSERNPFKYPTRIFKDKTSKANGFDYGLVKTEGNYQGLVLDGFILDATNRNRYKGDGDLLAAKSLKKPPINLGQADTHLRNCIIINTAHIGVYVRGAGSSVENCLIVNTVFAAIQTFGSSGTNPNETPVLLKNNTILFNWKNGVNGGYGIDIGTSVKVTMENNIIGMNEAYAVSNFLNVESDTLHSMINNAMFQNKKGNYAFFSAENKSTLVIDDPEDFEDSDLETAEDNILSDPFFKYEPTWFEKFSNQTAAEEPGKVNMDDMNQIRSMLGLPVMGPATKGRSGWAMEYPLSSVLKGALWTTDNEELEGIGVQVDGPFEIVHSKTVAKKKVDYQKITFEEVVNGGDKFIGKAVSFKAWYTKDNIAFKDSHKNEYIRDVTEKTHVGLELRPTPKMIGGKTIFAYLEIGAEAEHYFKKRVQSKGGAGWAETTNQFVVKGIIRKPGGFIREGALVMEVVEMGRK